MGITDYQIHSILSSYTRHLCHVMEGEDDLSGFPESNSGEWNHPKVKCKLSNMVDRVLADMLKKIVKEKKIIVHVPQNGNNGDTNENEFTYSVLNERSMRRTYNYSLKESGFLISHMEADKEP